MATIYSLICFGGKDGKTVTFTDAGDVVNLTNHGLRDGSGVVFSTTGALPTGITAGTTYYSKIGADISKFTIWTTSGLTTQVTFTGTGSGTNTVKGAYWSGLSVNAKARYGTAGSERAYNGFIAWLTARVSAALAVDTEICEISDAYIDYVTGTNSLVVPAASTRIESKINGVRSAAFHAGVVGAGYAIDQRSASSYHAMLSLDGTRHTLDGITCQTDQQSNYLTRDAAGLYNTIKNCIIRAYGSGANIFGFDGYGQTFSVYDNLFVGNTTGVGVNIDGWRAVGATVANNIAVKWGIGFRMVNTAATGNGWYHNNISIGNTTNWSAFTATNWYGAANNYGLAADTPWYKTTDTGITIATTDFVDYANNDFRPAAITSPQVEVAITVTGVDATDLADNERPNYVGTQSGTTITAGSFITGNAYTIVSVGTTDFTAIGASASTIGVTFKATGAGTGTGTALCIEVWDGGCLEFDHGYARPQVRNLVIPTLISGSQVQIFTTATTTALTGSTESSGTSLTQDMGADMTVDVTVMKAGYHPIRQAGLVLDSTTYTLTVDQEIDRTYVASSGLTYTTNATIDRTNKEVAINVDSTLQNFRNFCIEQWIDKGANGEALANLNFPFSVNGPNSITFENAWAWEDWGGGGTGSASIAHLSRDGMRYLNTSGNVVKAWCAVYTPDTPAGLQVQIEQVNGGTIVAADNTGPMDQLVQIISDPNGDGNYADGYDYTGHMQLRVQAVGYSKPLADVVATFVTLEDQLYSIGLAPTLLFATTDADPGGMTFTQATKAAVLTASRSILQLDQGSQWWTNQDAQWDADVPLTANTSGTTFTLATGWTLSGMNYITGTQTLTGGTITLAGPGTYTPSFSNTTLTAQGAGTYVLLATSSTITFAPAASGVTYVLGGGTFSGTIDLRNTHATNTITVELPTGTTYTTANNTGAAITVTLPAIYQSVAVTGFVAGSRLQIYDTTSSTELFNGTASAGDTVISGSTCTWTDSVAAAATRAIRLRVAKMATVTAKNFIDANIGTCATSGPGKDVAYLVSQTDDDAYNANAIDGSTVTGITITVGPSRVNINIAGGAVTWPSIYAFQVYWQATATGIAQETAFIEAKDTANYLLTDFDMKNTHANPLTITGGWGRDSVTLTVAGCIDSAGSTGNIYAEPDHVVAFATGSALTAGQAAELTAAASSAAAAAANADVPTSTRLATSGYTAPPSASTIASSVGARVIEAALTADEIERIKLAALAGKRQGLGTVTEEYMAQDGVTPRITLVPDSKGNGTPTLNGSA